LTTDRRKKQKGNGDESGRQTDTVSAGGGKKRARTLHSNVEQKIFASEEKGGRNGGEETGTFGTVSPSLDKKKKSLFHSGEQWIPFRKNDDVNQARVILKKALGSKGRQRGIRKQISVGRR